MSNRRRRLGLSLTSLGLVLALRQFLSLLDAGAVAWTIWGASLAVALIAVALAMRTHDEA